MANTNIELGYAFKIGGQEDVLFQYHTTDGQTYDGIVEYVSEDGCGANGFDQMDISGPDGAPDCRIDLYDLVEFCARWLTCTLPNDPRCE